MRKQRWWETNDAMKDAAARTILVKNLTSHFGCLSGICGVFDGYKVCRYDSASVDSSVYNHSLHPRNSEIVGDLSSLDSSRMAQNRRCQISAAL